MDDTAIVQKRSCSLGMQFVKLIIPAMLLEGHVGLGQCLT